ncbi:MAG TPA: PP0621 family protein [Noviherbaspirillum sp.]|uniref:PP0621 family protein n=1 Tax=Noviherbaspirillum sp. TaxID=1926288 RepID=UPI002B47373E|nr:PP0621 family protein [Noviherbaspirillum sp.]HJV88090.1 PP0621 family protein [Noviherbaspirillum sp.]
MKLLLWLAIAVFVIWVIRSNKSSNKTSAAAGTGRPDRSNKSNRQIEPMLQCAHCGVYVPVSETVTDASGKVFCSDDHRLQHARS